MRYVYVSPLQVRAAEVLFKLVSELKEYLILNDFTAINTTVTQHSNELLALQAKIEEDLQRLYRDYHQQALANSRGVEP